MSKSGKKIDTSKLKCFRTDDDWVISESKKEALQILKEFYNDEEYIIDLEIEEVPKDKTLKIKNFDGNDGEITKTIGEWIELNGKGYLCGTNF